MSAGRLQDTILVVGPLFIFYMKQINVYTGTGAYQARDIENFLGVFDYDFKRIHEGQLTELNSNDVLIVPGGLIADYLPTWGKSGIELIRKFISDGGVYIGICAGAYIAGKQFKGETGLNFFDQELKYGSSQETIDVTDTSGNIYQLITENGPDLSEIKVSSVILKDKKGLSQAIQINYGEGRVYLFAAHPEGSVFYRQLPQDFSGAKFFDQFLRQL